jgi:hypothetical protein
VREGKSRRLPSREIGARENVPPGGMQAASWKFINLPHYSRCFTQTDLLVEGAEGSRRLEFRNRKRFRTGGVASKRIRPPARKRSGSKCKVAGEERVLEEKSNSKSKRHE